MDYIQSYNSNVKYVKNHFNYLILHTKIIPNMYMNQTKTKKQLEKKKVNQLHQ